MKISDDVKIQIWSVVLEKFDVYKATDIVKELKEAYYDLFDFSSFYENTDDYKKMEDLICEYTSTTSMSRNDILCCLKELDKEPDAGVILFYAGQLSLLGIRGKRCGVIIRSYLKIIRENTIPDSIRELPDPENIIAVSILLKNNNTSYSDIIKHFGKRVGTAIIGIGKLQ
jgi:hypothetical protein